MHFMRGLLKVARTDASQVRSDQFLARMPLRSDLNGVGTDARQVRSDTCDGCPKVRNTGLKVRSIYIYSIDVRRSKRD